MTKKMGVSMTGGGTRHTVIDALLKELCSVNNAEHEGEGDGKRRGVGCRVRTRF